MTGGRDPAAKGDAETIVRRIVWLTAQAQRLGGDLDLLPGPSFPFYQDRWGSDSFVQIMNMAQRGMHLTLMTCAWQEQPFCSLPDDEGLLRAWCLQPDPETWEIDRAMLFSGKNGQPRRSWVYRDGRWFQIGLCRTLLEQIARRLRRQRATHHRYAQGTDSHRDHHRAMEVQCRSILDALQSLPFPSPSPVPVPSTESPNGDPPRARAKAGEPASPSPEVDGVWTALVTGRAAACKRLDVEPSRIVLTPKRSAHLRELVDTYGAGFLKRAFAAVERSDYHLGLGRHAERGHHLSFEAITSIAGAVNQVEILAQLAEQRRGGSSTGKGQPNGDADDASPIE